MIIALQVISVLLVSVAMALSLAHALELPGKMRLDEKTYTAMQPIYYPGFTIAGLSEARRHRRPARPPDGHAGRGRGLLVDARRPRRARGLARRVLGPHAPGE